MKCVIFDTETTGLVKNRSVRLESQPEIIEFYACFIDLTNPENVLGELNFLCKPLLTIKLEPIIEQITGLTYDRDLQNEQPFSFYATSVKDFIQQADYVIAHNIAFDKDMIEIEFERLQKDINWPRLICTVEQTKHLKGYNLKLSALYELLTKNKMKEAHRAKVDVQHLTECCKLLFKNEMLPRNVEPIINLSFQRRLTDSFKRDFENVVETVDYANKK